MIIKAASTLALLALAACCGRGATTTPALASAEAPRCLGPVRPWDGAARQEAASVVEASLVASDESNPLSLVGVADRASRRGERVYVKLPDEAIPLQLPGVERVDQRPSLPPGIDELRFWEITIVERYDDGALFKLEESLLFSDGRTSTVVLTACGTLVGGVPALRYLAGFAT